MKSGILIGAGYLALMAASAGVAQAESARSLCDYRERVLPRVTQLPANAPAIVVLPPGITVARDAGDMNFRLFSAAGTLQAATVEPEQFGSYLVRPSALLSEGHSSVEYLNVCEYYYVTNQSKRETVNVGPSVPLPTRVAVSTTESFSAPAICYPIQGQLKVAAQLTAEMFAYREVSTFLISFQGRTVRIPYGDYGVTNAITPTFLVDANACEKGQASVSGVLSITAHVAGSSSDPVRFEKFVDVPCPYYGVQDPLKVPACNTLPPAPAPSLDAGAVLSLDAGAPTSQPRIDGGLKDDDASGHGCSYAGRTSTVPYGPFIALSFWLLRLATRSRQMKRSSVRL